jgi:hypothetical protein
MTVDLSPTAERASARFRLVVRLGIAGFGCAVLIALGAGQAHAGEASGPAGPLARVATKVTPTVGSATTRAKAAARRVARPAVRFPDSSGDRAGRRPATRAPRRVIKVSQRRTRPVAKVERRLRSSAGALVGVADGVAPSATGTVLAALDAVVGPVLPGPLPAPVGELTAPRLAPFVSMWAPGAVAAAVVSAVVADRGAVAAGVAPASDSRAGQGEALPAGTLAAQGDSGRRQPSKDDPWLPTLPAAGTVDGGTTGGLGLLVVVLAGALLLAGPAGGRRLALAHTYGATRAPRPRTLPG